MSVAHNLVAFIVLISILVSVHEYGHYWVAKRCGIKVLTFSIGFGKPLFGWMMGETRWQVAALPLGGYVRMLDEREGPVELSEVGRTFNRQPLGRRALVIVAGPVANLLLAVLVYWGLFLGGVDVQTPTLGYVALDSLAAHAGFQVGDTVERVDGDPVEGWSDFARALLDGASGAKRLSIAVQRHDGQEALLTLDLSTLDKSSIEPGLLRRLGLYLVAETPILGDALPNSVAASAGLRRDDEIKAVDGRVTSTPDAFIDAVRASPAKPIHIQIDRAGKLLDILITPNAVKDESGAMVGQIGIGVGGRVDEAQLRALDRHVSLNPAQALGRAIVNTYDNAIFSLKMMWRVVTGHVSVKQLSGTIGIAKMAGKAASIGWKAYVELLAMISISIGVLNLLPIPVLDGGHLLYYSAELVRGRPLSEDATELGLRIGVGLLAVLIVVTLYNDIARMVGG